MRHVISVIVVIGVIFLIIGFGFFFAGMMQLDWDYESLYNKNVERNEATFELSDVTSLDIDVSTSSVIIKEDGVSNITVSYYIVKDKNDNALRQVIPEVKDGVLVCKEEVNNGPFTFFNFSVDDDLVITVPYGTKLDAKINVSTGNIEFAPKSLEITFGKVDITTQTGNIIMRGRFTCDSFKGKATTGSFIADGSFICLGDVEFEATTGDFSIHNGFEAKNVKINLTTGSVESEKAISFDSMDIKTTTGDVSLKLIGTSADYSYQYETKTGDSNVIAFKNGSKSIKVNTTTGDIELYFYSA